MRNHYKGLILALGFSLITACQTTSTNPSILKFMPTNDATTTATVQDEFKQNPTLAALPIRVQTINGAVSLSGYVKTIRQSDTAEEVARKTAGVKSVQNNLVVRK